MKTVTSHRTSALGSAGWPATVESRAYHQWRAGSELLWRVELPLLGQFLRESEVDSVLDVGTGTGLWANVCRMLHPTADIAGIDIADDLIGYARETSPSGIEFYRVHAAGFTPNRRYGLVLSSLSADYIGFPSMATCFDSALSNRGIGIMWYLDPKRYPGNHSYRTKRFVIGGVEVSIRIQSHDLPYVYESLRSRGLWVDHLSLAFALSDGIERKMYIVLVSRGREIESVKGSLVRISGSSALKVWNVTDGGQVVNRQNLMMRTARCIGFGLA